MEVFNSFLEHLSRLDNVHQWEERDSVIKESVSQHSFKVAAIAHYLLIKIEIVLKNDKAAFKAFKYGISDDWLVFKSDCLSYAILHDFDEAILGRDISHVVKYNEYNGEKIRAAINDFVNHQEAMDFNGLLPQPSKFVKKFVKVCDWIALHTFCYRNEVVGCCSFKQEGLYVEERLSKAIDEFDSILKLNELDVSLKKILENE